MNEFTPFQNAVIGFAHLFGITGTALLAFVLWNLARRQMRRPFLRILLYIGANLAGLRVVFLAQRWITGQSASLDDRFAHALATLAWLALLGVYSLSVWLWRRHQRKTKAVKADIENVMEDLPIAESRQSAWPVTTEETSSAKVMLGRSER